MFVSAPTFEENERRLRERATESEGEIDERLDLARAQLDQAAEFDHVVVNDDLDRALDELTRIVRDALSDASGDHDASGTMPSGDLPADRHAARERR